MKALQKLILYPLCLLYAITPGSKRLESDGSHYYDALVLGIFQALIIPGIIYYFSSAPQTTYFGLVASVGPWVGGWTFLGGIYYPILSAILDEDKKSVAQKEREAQAQKLENAREEYDKRMSESKAEYYAVLTKNAPPDIYRKKTGQLMLTEGGPKCYKQVLAARIFQLEHRTHDTETLWMKDEEFVQREAERFGIENSSVDMLRVTLKKADGYVDLVRRLADKKSGKNNLVR